LQEIPIIRGKGGVLRAKADMVSAGFSANPLSYGDERVYASKTPFPNVSQSQSTPPGFQTFTSPYAYRFTAYGKAYAAAYPAPILALKRGQKLDINITNQLADNVGVPSDSLYETNFHTHGFHVSPLSMGDNIYPSINDASGALNVMRVRIPLPENQPDGINWYHVHHHTQTNPQVYGGLAGFITVGNPLDPWPRYKPSGLRPLKQLYLMLSEVNLQRTDEVGQVPEPSGLVRLLPYGGTGSVTQNLQPGKVQANWQKRVNGQLNPIIKLRPGETQVWNLAATGAFGGYNLAITDGQLQNSWQATLLTLDGNADGAKPLNMQLNADPARMQDRVANTLIMSGNRLTMAVTAPQQPGTYYLIDGWGGNNDYLVNANNQQGYIILATLEVSGKPETRKVPVFAADAPDYSLFNAPVDKRRRFEFSIKPGANKDPEGFLINGQPFGSDTMPQLQIGTIEEWTLVNVTTGSGQNINQANHPFHIHQGGFIVTAVNDVPVDPNITSPINALNYITPRDTVNIPINGSVKIKFMVEDYPGKYVFHCHILKHEDQGMMDPVLAFGPKDGLRSAFGYTQTGYPGLMNVIDGTGRPLVTRYPFGKGFTGALSTADALGAAKYYSTYAVGMASRGFDVAVYGGKNQAQLAKFQAFRPDVAHPGQGVSVALGDINGDGLPEVIVGSRQAGTAQLKIFTTHGKLLHTYDGLIPGDFPKGINVAAGDINSDNYDDVIIGAGDGHEPVVMALDGRAIAEHQTPSVLIKFIAGGGATAGARVAVGYVAPGTRPSYLANILTTPESGPDAGYVDVWNPYAVMPQHTGMVMHSDSYPTTLQSMARYQPFSGKTESLQISTGYLGSPGIPQAFAWTTPGQVAATVINESGQTQTQMLYLPQ
ncbi:MAG: multicopper oxidase domain-containing protein, partial [Methylococcaceae bacterium]